MAAHENGLNSSIFQRLLKYFSSRLNPVFNPPTFTESATGTDTGAQMISDMIESGAVSSDEVKRYYNNLFTGDLDFQRSVDLLQAEQAFNSAEAEKNRIFQTEMSNSAYQRQAQDLRNAGYNPALILGGSGASVMSVNTPSANASYGGISNGMTQMLSTAMSAQAQSNSNIISSLLNGVSRLLSSKKK